MRRGDTAVIFFGPNQNCRQIRGAAARIPHPVALRRHPATINHFSRWIRFPRSEFYRPGASRFVGAVLGERR